MKLSTSLLFSAQILSILALPAPPEAGKVAANTTAGGAAGAGEAGGAAGGEAGAEENEVEQQGQFGTVITLGGGDIKTDTVFPPGTNGALEVEFQNPQGRQLRVTENPAPAAAPKGFVALEPVSYIVELSGGAAGAQGLTLQKIDYIQNAESTTDISAGQVGRFCTEANSFVFGEGDFEFEAEEKELSLSVTNMVGEWAFFVPDPAAAGGEGAGEDAGAGAAEGGAAAGEPGTGKGAGTGADASCAAGTACRTLVDALRQLVGGQV